MRIVIETKPFNEMRYETQGDYFYDEKGDLQIQIAESGNDDFNFLVMMHELTEEKLTRKNGKKEEDILKFDLWVEDEVDKGNYPEYAQPGDHPLCIYRDEHRFSENIERILAYELGYNFEDYDKELMKITK